MHHQEPITILPEAVNKIWELINEEENPELKLRVYVTGGGCSGLQYGFSFTENAQEHDVKITKSVLTGEGKIQVILDPISLQYLKNAEIDYKNDLTGEQFIIRNPNAKTSCSCGSSFSTEDL